MTVYFYSPDYAFPSGGVRVLYRHVDILNKHGIEAYVLHTKRGFRCTWFENTTQVAYLSDPLEDKVLRKLRRALGRGVERRTRLEGGASSFLRESDVIAVPEIYGPSIFDVAPGIPVVVLNQNCYLSFQGYPLDSKMLRAPYDNPLLRGVMINSEDGREYLEFAFPDMPVTRFRLGIDSTMFNYRSAKKKLICYTPRKNELVVRQVVNLLKFRGRLGQFQLVPFSGRPQSEVAELMKDSAIFLSFGQYEGFGLPPAEAMACGCIVIGYHAGGGKEFMRPEFSFPIAYGEVLDYVRTIEDVVEGMNSEPGKFEAMGRAASDFILEQYAMEKEEEDVVRFWSGVA
ncbi:glycosyltransferase family 4 protein [Methyloversatilis discipulorum]|uniref:glycosyltransferase family 4 protein n=1 Tax=Methyloversatilis discipulorum TaxID=1119528 RepID=UPI003AF46FB1